MPRSFYSATAEQVIATVEAVVVNPVETSAEFAAEFADIPLDQARSALLLSVDLGFLTTDNNCFKIQSPLCRLISTGEPQRAPILRTILESYQPFTFFRTRLITAPTVSDAARQTKVVLDLNAHHDAIKDTLVSLGTYSQALQTLGGGRYSSSGVPIGTQLEIIAAACIDIASAEAKIIQHIGVQIVENLSNEEVIQPLANALLCAVASDPRGAVVRAGNAVESYLLSLGTQLGLNLAGANGINAKVNVIVQNRTFGTKILNVSKYLGHVRNAADHGVDPEVNAPWTITNETGYQYVLVACTFISVTLRSRLGEPPML